MSDKIGFTKAVMNVFKREQDSQFTAEYRLLTEDDKRDLYHGKPMDVSQNPRNY
jgi:hypothetical protein